MIDASVFVADARPSEPSHAESTALLSVAVELDAELLLPAIVLPEIASAIARGTGRSDLARWSVALYRRLPGVRIVPIDPTLADVAAIFGAEHRLRGCDAIYVALARAADAMLVSLDRKQLDRSPDTIVAVTPANALDLLATR